MSGDDFEELWIEAPQLARILNITERRVQQLVKQGLPRTARGRYPLVASVHFYIATLRENRPETSSIEQARLRKLIAQADREELELARERNQVVAIDDAMAAIGRAIGECRAKLLALPSKLAPEVALEKSKPMCRAIIETGIHDALADLASAGLQDDARRDPRARGRDRGDHGDLGTAAKAHDKPMGRRKPKAQPGKQRRARKMADK